MKEEKVKVNLRVGLLIRETLVDEAAVEDIRVGTLANRLLQSEMDKVMKVGADNCLIMNSREYLASEAEIEQNRAGLLSVSGNKGCQPVYCYAVG